uniref:UspA domain-containing protein n=1 Tax=Kalanchoe fedtschenkoi TaxID=63787 RepID=A0A7N0RIK8_KALFE
MAESTVSPGGAAEAGLSSKKAMKVMVAVDDSEESFYALNWALDYVIGGGDNGMVTVVNVQHPFQHYIYPAGPAVYATSSVLESVRKAQEQNSAAILASALQICQAKMVRAETLILNGDPKEMICEAADQMRADLLVMSSRGLGAIKRAFLGSVSDYCVHHATCPILIVKPPKERK